MTLRHKFALPVVAACLCLTASPAHAAVTLQFSLATVGRATGFSDSAGLVGVNGMRWGVVVDTSQNGLLGAGPTPTQMYDAGFDLNTSGFLTVNNVLTDDYYVAHPSATLTSTLSATGPSDPGGPGGITAITGVPYGGSTGIGEGDPFGIIWFQSGTAFGNAYGLLENQLVNAQFDIPADTAIASFASTYFTNVNPDVIKPANLTLQGVPEPSRLLLLGLGGAGLLLRRRRC